MQRVWEPHSTIHTLIQPFTVWTARGEHILLCCEAKAVSNPSPGDGRAPQDLFLRVFARDTPRLYVLRDQSEHQPPPPLFCEIFKRRTIFPQRHHDSKRRCSVPYDNAVEPHTHTHTHTNTQTHKHTRRLKNKNTNVRRNDCSKNAQPTIIDKA